MQPLYPAIGTVLALLLILVIVVLGVLAWRRHRHGAVAQQAQSGDTPDKTVQRPVWRPGDGNQ